MKCFTERAVEYPAGEDANGGDRKGHPRRGATAARPAGRRGRRLTNHCLNTLIFGIGLVTLSLIIV